MQWTRNLALLALLPLTATAAGDWVQPDGRPVAQTESMKSQDGFGATLLVTTDPDWLAKWQTPTDTTPKFSVASEVHAGEQVSIIAFISNPQLDAKGVAQVECDVRVTLPDGSVATEQKELPCFSSALEGPSHQVFLTNLRIQFTAQADAPKGTWTVQVVARDTLRGVSLPLQASYELR